MDRALSCGGIKQEKGQGWPAQLSRLDDRMVEMCEIIKLDGSDYRSGRRLSGKPYCGFLALAGIDRKSLPDTNLF